MDVVVNGQCDILTILAGARKGSEQIVGRILEACSYSFLSFKLGVAAFLHAVLTLAVLIGKTDNVCGERALGIRACLLQSYVYARNLEVPDLLNFVVRKVFFENLKKTLFILEF